MFGVGSRSRSSAPAPALSAAEAVSRLRALSDRQWGRYAFSREPLEGKFTAAQKDSLAAKAFRCGEEQADRALAAGIRTPSALAESLEITVLSVPRPSGGGLVLFAQYAEPDEITIFTDCLDRAAELGPILPPRETLFQILLAHELFHVIETRNPDIFTRTEKVELWRNPFSNRSRISCLSEIAAMAFARRLLNLEFCPYLLDVMLIWPYDDAKASELCDEILALAAETAPESVPKSAEEESPHD